MTPPSDHTREEPRLARRAWLFCELVGLFVAIPTGLWWLHTWESRPPVIPTLLLVTLAILVLLWIRHPRTLKKALRFRAPRLEVRRVLLTFAAGAILLSIYTAQVEPELLLELPREKPWLWLAILFFYPLLSVVPQELVFRVFLLRRYRDLLPSPEARILVSALLFGFAHIVYGNTLSILLSTAGGFLFGLTYHRTRSIWLVSLEHALYGIFLFTIGLGAYFY